MSCFDVLEPLFRVQYWQSSLERRLEYLVLLVQFSSYLPYSFFKFFFLNITIIDTVRQMGRRSLYGITAKGVKRLTPLPVGCVSTSTGWRVGGVIHSDMGRKYDEMGPRGSQSKVGTPVCCARNLKRHDTQHYYCNQHHATADV